MRDTGIIMDEIGAKWSSMSTLEQNQLAYVIAGVRQRNIFIAAMEDYNKVLDATEVAENANGVAAEKMTVYNESLAAAQNRLTASIQQFAQDSNLDRVLALAYDGLSKVMEILNVLLNKIPILSPMIKALGVTLAASFAAGTIANMVKTSTILSSMVSVIPSMISAFTSASGAIQGLGAALYAAAGPFGVILGLIGGIIALAPAMKSAWDMIFPSAEQKAEDAQKALQETQTDLDETKSKIKEVQDKIDDIDSGGPLTLADEAEKQRLQEQLDVLNQIKDTQEAINQEQKGKTLEAEQARAGEMTFYSADEVSQYQSALGVTGNYATAISTDNINELIAAYRQLNEEKKNLDATDEDYAQQVATNDKLTSNFTTKLLEQKQAYLNEMQTLAELGDTNSEYYRSLQNSVNMINATIDPSKFPKYDLGEMISTQGMEEKIKMAVQSGSEAGKKVAENYAKEFANQLTSPGNEADLQAWKDALNIPDSQELGVDQLIQEILALFYQMYGGISTEADAATVSVYSQKDALEMYQEAVQQVHDNTTDLTAAYQDMIDKGYISETVVKKLTAAHPELVKELKLEDGQYKINIQTLKEAHMAEVNQAQASMKAQKESAEVTIEAIESKILAFELEKNMLALDPNATDSDKAKLIGLQHSIDMWKLQLDQIKKNTEGLDTYISEVDKLRDWSPPSKKSGSSKSTTDKTAQEFENKVKTQIKNLKEIVTLYSQQEDWMTQETIDKFTKDYNKALESIVNNPEARKIAADALGVDISEMSAEEAIDAITKLLEEQAGTITEAHQKLVKADLEAKEKELKAIQEVEKAEKEQYDKALEYIGDLEDATIDMIETGIDLLEKAGDIVFDLLGKISDRYDKQLDSLDKISDELDKQKDDFEDKIDAQKEYLKLQKEEMDNANELAEKNKSIADIDAQLMELQYDNSAEAQVKRLKLLDERAEKEKDLADWQNEYDYNAKIDALDREKSQYEKTIEAEKKALEAQKETIEASQKSFETTLSNIQSGFNTFTKILSSDLVKGLLSKALISYGGQGYQNLMFGWNRIFGTGMDSTMTNLFGNYNQATNLFGYQQGQWIGGYQDWLTGASNTQQNILDTISAYQTKISTTKSQLEAGAFDLSKAFTDVVDVPAITDNLNQVKTAFGDYQSYVMNTSRATDSSVKRVFSKGINSIFGTAVNSSGVLTNAVSDSLSTVISAASGNYIKIAKSGSNTINSIATNGIRSMTVVGQSGQGVLSSLGDTAQGVLNTVVNSGNSLVSNIGNVIKSTSNNIGGFLNNILSALGIGGVSLASVPTMTATNTAAATGLSTVIQSSGMAAGAAGFGTAAGATGIAGALGPLAIGIGGAALTAGTIASSIYNIKKIKETLDDDTKSTGEKVGNVLLRSIMPAMVPGASIGMWIWDKLIGKHHSGADYVKKQNPALDRMLGLGADETVSILKVGEAVVPTWANNATSSANSNSYTGSPFGNAVQSAAKSARFVGRSSRDTTSSSITVSMPINIQGDADAATVKALKEEANNIVNRVIKTINNQTRVGGYRNIKAATV